MDSLIKTQIAKINTKQEILSKQLISQSKYAGMSRESRRELEGYVDSLNILAAQEKDINKAQILGERIGEILEKTRKMLDILVTKANTYTFPLANSGEGGSCDCSGGMDASGNMIQLDLTTDLAKREAWEMAVMGFSENILSYLNSQYLGDYSLLHHEVSGGCCTGVYYRPVFTYLQVINNNYTGINQCTLVPPTNNDFIFVINNPDLGYADFHQTLVSELQDLEDETQLVNLLRLLQNKLDDIRAYQSQNDKDMVTLESVDDVNEQNKLFYGKLVDKTAKIDEEEIKMKLSIGQSLIRDLRSLQKETYDKSCYFSLQDVVSNF